MKSNKTMLALARAKAYTNEIQKISIADGVDVICYALRMKDISILYKEQGFTNPLVAHRHVEIWKSLGLVKTYYNDLVVVFIPLITDYDEISALMMEQKKSGSSTVAILPKEATA